MAGIKNIRAKGMTLFIANFGQKFWPSMSLNLWRLQKSSTSFAEQPGSQLYRIILIKLEKESPHPNPSAKRSYWLVLVKFFGAVGETFATLDTQILSFPMVRDEDGNEVHFGSRQLYHLSRV